ncbi:FAD-binding protein [Candidatus Aerophobetes bacterium]|uniref:FAD-binding protein n=1 Tax=Aerophobetes bacterium TaxID=2030807 RepID=A0A523QJC6_UNCAE|nr:MAG: FAD-binding protein [Candidatus Aerophobetes bacterium]
MYAKVDDEVLKFLTNLFDRDEVLVDPDLLEKYSHDEVAGLKAEPEVVVRATTVHQISKLMNFANEKKIPVTPRGAGYGLSGGAVPIYGGIVLSLEKMDRILEIDKKNLMITVEPGVITGKIHEAVEKEGLFYPPDPASLDSCSIGGNIAECAGGPRAIKYGVTREYVCGLEAVLPSGEIIQLGGKLVKNVTGYDLIQLLIGSEGTLAIITRIILRLIPLPRVTIDLLVAFNEFQAAADTASAIIERQILPTSIEFMEQDSLLACEKYLKKELPLHDAAAFLLIKLDGNRKEDVQALCESVGEVCFEHDAVDVLVADDRPTQERLWEGRRAIVDALKERSPVNHMEDVVVPRARISDFLREIRKLQEKYGYPIICFGHSGDGNVHVNVLKEDRPEDKWKGTIPKISEEIFDIALALGGQITGEHGVGATRRQYLEKAVGPKTVQFFRGIKQLFDPSNILNPGKIFPPRR